MDTVSDFVLAGSIAQFRHFQRANPKLSLKYLWSKDPLYGIRNRKLYLIGSYTIRPDWKDIILCANSRDFKIIDVDLGYQDFKFENVKVNNEPLRY